MSIKHWISQHATATPDKTAIHFYQNDELRSFSYAALERAITRTEDYFNATLQLNKGDRIAWYGMNNPDMLVLLFAAARCEVILVPLNWRLALPEVRFIVEDCAPRALFFDHHFADHVPALLTDSLQCTAIPAFTEMTPETSIAHPKTGGTVPRYPGLTYNHTYNQADTKRALLKVRHSSTRIDAPLMIVYTSGTGGHPKGAVLDQKSFGCNARMSWHMHDMTAKDHILSFLPMFHVGGFNIQMLPALALGATTTLLEKFDPDDAIRLLNTGDITLTLTVPTILQALLTHPQWSPQKLIRLRALSIGSTDVPIALIQALHQINIPLLQVYGTTETSPLAIYLRAEHAFSSEGSIGQCGSLCDIRLVNSSGDDVDEGENGEVWVKGDNILQSYWNNPQATQQAMAGEWFRTGDVARRDTQGFYWFADRLKHVIISGGENIYAAELERVIRDFPGLTEMVIVGKPDPKWGEVAVVVGVRDHNDSRNDEQLKHDILERFQGKLARFKHPRDVVFVPALPRTALGKIQSDKVKALISDGATPSS